MSLLSAKFKEYKRKLFCHSGFPIIVLCLTILAVVVLLIMASWLTQDDDTHHGRGALLVFHTLATIAIVSTCTWSWWAFVGLFQQENFTYAGIIGGRTFLRSLGMAALATLACVAGVICVWVAWSYSLYCHLAAVTLAEMAFWGFDSIVIRRVKAIRDDSTAVATNGVKSWSDDTITKIEGWRSYVDRPATVAFAVLTIVTFCATRAKVIKAPFETEAFASGAVFFALMAANLAFLAANSVLGGPVDAAALNGEARDP